MGQTKSDFTECLTNLASVLRGRLGQRHWEFTGKKMEEGTIKRITDKGFGFIARTDSTKDLFFHSSSVINGTFNELREGQQVTFTVGQGPKGPCAENVQPG